MGKMVEYMPSCHSTNDSARELISNTAISEGHIVITDHQIKGRGQRGNSWLSEAGKNLTFSIVLKPSFLAVTEQFYLNMVASLAVRNGIADFTEEAKCEVKWPNDVFLNDRKVCGILIENLIKGTHFDYSIVGIGLNVNQLNISVDRATSLSKEMGCEFDLQLLLDKILHHFESLYLKLKSGNGVWVKEKYLQHLLGFRELRRFKSEFEFAGEIVDVLDSGKLKVRTQSGMQFFEFKEIEFIWN